MTTLLCQTLVDVLEQQFTYNNEERVHIVAIMPYLYMGNAPSGDVIFEFLNSDNDVLFSSTFTSNDIKTSINTANNFAHVFYPVIPLSPVQIGKGVYKIRLSAGSGYFANGSSFIGWIQQHENRQNEITYIPANDTELPLAFRVKILKEGIL